MLKRVGSISLNIAAVAGCLYGMVCLDLFLRAKKAYLEGEKYYSWHLNSAAKEAFYAGELKKAEKALEKALAGGKIKQEEFIDGLSIEKFRYENALGESPLKYAYFWYQAAVELFPSPLFKWQRLSRERMVETRELWKKELEAKGIPAAEYIFE